MVIRWRDLHHIHGDEIDVRQLAYDRRCLMIGEATGNGRSSARCRRRIKAIDIESQVCLVRTDDRPDDAGDVCSRTLMHLIGVDDAEAVGCLLYTSDAADE